MNGIVPCSSQYRNGAVCLPEGGAGLKLKLIADRWRRFLASAVLVAALVGIAARPAAGSLRLPSAAIAGAAVVPYAPVSIAPPSRGHGATIALIEIGAEARAHPGQGKRVWWVGTATGWTSEPQVLMVLGSAQRDGRQWLRVLLPIRPNHTTAWIPRDNVVLLSTPYWIAVSKSARRVTVYRKGKLIHRFPAVIGKPATPTPDGLAAIYEVDPQLPANGFLGPWALPLTVFSNVLYNFGGGPGRVAIHGRDGASLDDPLGSARSHGCIRIEDPGIDWMAAQIPQGSPVQITG